MEHRRAANAATQLTVIVVTHDSAAVLPACIEALRSSGFDPPPQIVVVDNASRDGTAGWIRESCPEVTLLANESNLGLSRAVNQGWRTATGRYLLLLNPDVVVRPGALQVMHEYLESRPEVGLVAPLLRNPDGSLQLSCRHHYDLWTYLLRRTPLGKLFPDHPALRRHLMMDWDHAEIRQVDWALGAAMMIRREAIGATVMDERFFLYFEDVDLCLRLQRAGWEVIYHPGAEMLHHHRRASADGIVNRSKFEHFKSWMRFSLKHARHRARRS